MILKKKKSKEKYNGFWKWLFYVEIIITLFLIHAIFAERPSSIEPVRLQKCASAICDCQDGKEFCKCTYAEYHDEGEDTYETVYCPNRVKE